MIYTALMTTWLLGAGTGTVQEKPSNVLVLDIFAHVYRGDGSRTASGGNSAPAALEGFVWIPRGFCGVGASGKPPGDVPAVGWHYSGRVIDRTPDALTVRIEWERVRDLSTAAAETPLTGNTTATLRQGDLVELDRMLPTGQVLPCQTAIVKLEASVALRSPSPGTRGGGTRLGGGTRVGGGVGIGAGVGAVGGGGAGSGSGGAVFVGPGSVAGPSYNAELWLVHRPPNGGEETQRQVVRVGSNSLFVFPPVSIATAQGKADVEVSGALLSISSDGVRLLVTVSRRIITAGEPDRTGNTARIIALPAPNEVIAFELPSSGQDSLAAHQFSLRLRVMPK